MLFLVGGPSQLDTWDMKPDAPEEIRGPFKPIATKVPGLQVSEVFPRLAMMMDRVALVRSVYHTAAAVHDTGHQMMQTGRLFTGGIEHPHVGCVVSKLRGPKGDAPPHVLLPRPIGATGGNMPHGQDAGLPRQDVRPVRAERRPERQGLQGPRPPAAGLRDERPRVAQAVAPRGDRRRRQVVRVVGRRPAARRELPAGLPADVEHDGPRGVRPQGRARRRPRPLRPDPVRPELPAGPPAGRAGRAVRHGQHVRDGLQRDHLGHPRLGPVQPDRVLQERGRPELRQRLHRAASRTSPAAACSTTR